MGMISQYALNLLMGIDQFLSTVLGGHPDDTISQRLGRAKLAKGGLVVMIASRIVDALAFILVREKNHCVKSLSGKSSARELWNWGGSRDQIKIEED